MKGKRNPIDIHAHVKLPGPMPWSCLFHRHEKNINDNQKNFKISNKAGNKSRLRNQLVVVIHAIIL